MRSVIKSIETRSTAHDDRHEHVKIFGKRRVRDTTRNFSVDSLERYIEKTGDTTPVMYLVEKFLAPDARPANAKQVQAIKDQMLQMMRQLETLGAA
jgi:hypothetical protein